MPNLQVNYKRIAIFAGIFVLFLMVIEFNSRLNALILLNERRDEVRAIATQGMQTVIAQQTQVAYAESDAAVEEWARTEGHYAKEGEQAVIPIGEAGSNEPVIPPTPTPVPTPMQNWEVWWNLFFEK